VDLVEPDRLERRLKNNPRLRDTLFHPGEIEYCEAQPDPIQHLASRYCAKEAVMKALGADAWDPLDVEVVGGGEQTELRLHHDLLLRARQLRVEVTISMSHLPTMAIAVAMARAVK
jgi:holo-[acyl-carrier protein] synthase